MSIEVSRGKQSHAVPVDTVEPVKVRGVLVRLELWAQGLSPARAALLAALVGIALTASSLWVGFAQDDYAILSVFKGAPGLESLDQPVLNAFSFSEGDPERNQLRMETGIIPWWTAEGWKVNLWRPLTSLSHWVDYLVFGESALPMHVHSLLLYGALCAAATLFYFRVSPAGWVAALAGFLFAIDAAHGIPAGWIANRNAVLCGLFSVLALLAHHRWRSHAEERHPWRSWRQYGLLSSLCVALALLSAEAAVGVGAYFFAYAVTIDPVHSKRQSPAPGYRGVGLRSHTRAISFLLPYLGVVAIWRAVYSGLGFGASESWLYVDPVAAPGVFVRYVVAHTPPLLATLLGAIDTQVWLPMSPLMKALYAGGTITALVLLGWLVRPVWKGDAVLRFWVIGCVLSIIPVAGATLPADRNIMLPSIGSAAAIAILLSYAAHWAFGESTPRRRLTVAFATFFLVTNVSVSALLLVFNAYSIRSMHVAFEIIDATVSAEESVKDETVVVLNTPLDLLGASLPVFRSGMERPAPANWWWLYAGDDDLALTRVDSTTLQVRPATSFMERPWAQLFRRPDAAPVETGYSVSLSRMEVTVNEASADGRPLDAEFRFDAPLEDASFRWLAWSGAGYSAFELPAIGETVTVPGVQPGDIWRLATAFLDGDAGTTPDSLTD